MTSHDIGDLIRLNAFFKNIEGQPTDPTGVTCSLRRPNGTLSTATVVDDPGDGAFHIDAAPVTGQHGIWYYRFTGTGAVQDTVQGAFNVRQPAV